MNVTSDPKNARTHDERSRTAVAKSLKKLGAGRSIVVDSAGIVIGGNATLAEAERLGIPLEFVHTTGDRLVVVVRDDMSPGDAKRSALAVADNRSAELAEWDMPGLLAALDSAGDMLRDAAGFTEEDFEKLSRTVARSQRDALKAAAGDIGDKVKPTAREVKVGQVWGWKRHTLSVGDCRNVAPPDGCDCVLFDPPFQWQDVYTWMPKPRGGQTIIVFSDAFRVGTAGWTMRERGWNGIWEFVWDGGSSWYVAGRPLARHKVALVGWQGEPRWDFDAARYVPTVAGAERTGTVCGEGASAEGLDKCLSTVYVQGNTATDGEGHTQQKPVEWIRAILRGVSARVIWDMAAGSGAWSVLADAEGMEWHGCEIDPVQAAWIVGLWESQNDGGQPEVLGACVAACGEIDSDPDPGRYERSKFYRSAEWRKLRAVCEDASGGNCQQCGAYVPNGERHIDHIVPRSKGGKDNGDNLRMLCQACHCRKSGAE